MEDPMMRGRPVALAVVALLASTLLAGCWVEGASTAERVSNNTSDSRVADAAAPPPSPTALPTASASPEHDVAPASSAGGLCRRLSYDTARTILGPRFDVAAASGAPGGEQTCVLQRVGAPAPDLTFSVIPAEADAEAFQQDFQPANARPVTGLGQAAYSQVTAAAESHGPEVEVCWLGKNAVYTLTYTTTRSTGPGAASKVVPRLVKLARTLTR
jgi:hypothetical protein